MVADSSKKKRKSKPSLPVTVTHENDGSSSNTETEYPVKELKLKSPVWDHYKVKFKRGKRVARCKYCNERIPVHETKNGTSSARCHYNSCLQNPRNKHGGACSKSKQTYLNFQKVGSGDDGKPSAPWRFDIKAIRKALVVWKIVDEESFSSVEKPGFRNFWKVAVHPSHLPPSRATLTRDCLKMHYDLKTSLKRYFSTQKQRVSLTTDTWTSNQKLCYMSLTAHFIDENWKLQKKNH